jgi:hypothetical protein
MTHRAFVRSHHLVTRAVILTALGAGLAAPAAAQTTTELETSYALGIGFARAGLRGGGSAGAIHTRFTVHRPFNRQLGALVSVDAYGMSEGVSTPSCVPGSPAALCEQRWITPGLLLGTSTGLVAHPAGDAVALLATVGGYYAPTIRSSQPRATAAFTAGADFELPWRSRFTPLVGVRFVYFSTPLANVRTLAGPGTGVGF